MKYENPGPPPPPPNITCKHGWYGMIETKESKQRGEQYLRDMADWRRRLELWRAFKAGQD